jgi:hypothetical protein
MGLAGTCSALASQLVNLKYKEELAGSPGDIDPQMRLFQLDTKAREEFTKFAKNLRWFADDHDIHDENYWKGYREHEFNDYDFYKFFEGYSDEELNKLAAALEKVGNGEELESYDETVEALNAMHGRAYSRVDRGGCF